MLRKIEYDRNAVVEYAKKWAYKRNPAFSNFSNFGGDCTNFASQCVYAGCGVMNYTPNLGWYYINLVHRAPAWTSVEDFYNFLTSNRGEGPYATVVDRSEVEIGDIIQLSNLGNFYHSLVITDFQGNEILVSAHTNDVYDFPLSLYRYDKIRYLHIEGVRKWTV